MTTLEYPSYQSETFKSADYQLFNLKPKSRVLHTLAHPDDEALEVALLGLHATQDVEVFVIVATDGEASSKGDQRLVKNRYRQQEMRRSLEFLGVSPENQFYLGLDDFYLSHPDNAAKLGEAIDDIAYQQGIDAFFTTGDVGYEDDDHRTVHDVTIETATTIFKRGVDVSAWSLTEPGLGDVYIPFNAQILGPVLDIHWTQFGTPQDRAELAKYGAAVSHLTSIRQVPLLGSVALY